MVAVLAMFAAPVYLVADREDWVPDALIQKARNEYGRRAMYRMERWRDMMHDAADLKDEKDILEEVNNFFNSEIPFRDDLKHWQRIDYWATPYESLVTDGGDCEDYVIAKYYSLLRLGVSSSKLRITYVKALDYNQAHMVLTYFSAPGVIPVVLDNLTSRIRPATERKDLKPVYSFNGDGMWLAKMKGEGVRLGSSNQLDLWTDLRIRMARIGMDL